jgi:A/G-specific adenine glycosylase
MHSNERRLVRRLLAWYDRSRRNLPWRLAPDATADARLDPYHVLVSETMLQQTQVATVIPYFRRFIARFPTVGALADADEQEVLRFWQGLGYYSRARNLHRAAKTIVARHGGKLPENLQGLQELPGVGRYTAGAIASIAFGLRAPALDGNVARVLCRLDRVESEPRERETVARLWQRAEEILPDARRNKTTPRFGDLNSALMELGATVCTPRKPQCLICPVREHCEAFAAGVQDRIPPPRKAIQTPLLERWTLCIRRRADDRWLIEQRPATGRWAGMWQFVTIEPAGQKPTRATVRKAAAIQDATALKRLGLITHSLTHRRYHFEVFTCQTSDGEKLSAPGARPRRWINLAEVPSYPLPRPHLKVAGMLAELLMGA